MKKFIGTEHKGNVIISEQGDVFGYEVFRLSNTSISIEILSDDQRSVSVLKTNTELVFSNLDNYPTRLYLIGSE